VTFVLPLFLNATAYPRGNELRLKFCIVFAVVSALAACGPSEDASKGETVPAQAEPAVDIIPTLVKRLDLARYKATIKGLTQFGDRLQGTDRNRAAVDWIEGELKSYGCTTERFIMSTRRPKVRPLFHLQPRR